MPEWGIGNTFGNPDPSGPIIHDIEASFTTTCSLVAALGRYRRPVTEKSNEWGRPEWAEIVWAGTGDKVVSRTGQRLDVALKRIRSAKASLTTSSQLDSQIIRIKPASAEFVTSSELQVLIRGAARGLLDYQGSLAPGETIELNTKDLLLTKAGVNIRTNAAIPEWIRLQPGQNVIVYDDAETDRIVTIEIIKKDRII